MEEKKVEHKEEILEQETENIKLEENDTVEENTLEMQLSEQKDKFLRLFAEFDNYKKRMAKEKLDYMAMAGKDMLLEFLSVKDDFERAMQVMENSEDMSATKEGIKLIYDKFNSSFDKKGVKKIEAKGQPFDVEKHEAITEIEIGDASQKGMVVDELETGYMLYDKIIRFSKVVVGK